MSPPHEQDAPVAPSPSQDPPPQPKVDIALSTSVNGKTISILGSGNASIPVNQAATRFNFTLNDTSGANVQFSSLDAADNTTSCPPVGSGNQSSQIVGVTINPPNKTTAGFTDNNSNAASNGPMNVSYQWEFTCNSGFTVQPFDPIISNGGRSGPVF